jgi:hypothetical protein
MHQQVAALEAAAAEARAALAAERRAAGNAAVQLHGLQVANEVIIFSGGLTVCTSGRSPVPLIAKTHMLPAARHWTIVAAVGSWYYINMFMPSSSLWWTQHCRGLCQSQ